jgi:hypothetical protein
MARVSPYYSIKNPGKYHVCSKCTEGNKHREGEQAGGDRGRHAVHPLCAADRHRVLAGAIGVID